MDSGLWLHFYLEIDPHLYDLDIDLGIELDLGHLDPDFDMGLVQGSSQWPWRWA